MAPSTVRRKRRAAAGLALVILGFVLFMVGPVVAIFFSPAWLVIVPVFVAFALMAAGGALYATSSGPRPAGSLARAAANSGSATVTVTCPNCGAAPASFVPGETVTCAYCGTPFLVA